MRDMKTLGWSWQIECKQHFTILINKEGGHLIVQGTCQFGHCLNCKELVIGHRRGIPPKKEGEARPTIPLKKKDEGR